MNLATYSDHEYLLASRRLSEHINKKEIFSLKKTNVGLGITITGNLDKKIYRQSYYKDCVFDEASCIDIGFSGSKFINTIFKKCNLKNGNLHSCDFEQVHFLSKGDQQAQMIGTGFHKSTFYDCIFENLYIYSCGFTDVIFYNTVFKNCTLCLCSLENAQFKHCYFINTYMSTLNLEYSEFDETYAQNTIFPFITIPSAYGLLQDLTLNENNSNMVYSASNEEHKISIKKYLTLLPDFECYYHRVKNYYALANIYICQKNVQGAYEMITEGLLNTIKTKDFRSLRHFCKLVHLSTIFTVYQRRTLYENIMKWVAQEQLSISEYHNYELFSGSIRNLLLNDDYGKPTVFFYLETNINPDEIQKQTVLLSTINQILDDCNINSSSIELRHNSAYVEFLTIICNSIAQFSQTLMMIYSSLAGIKLFSSSIKNIAEVSQNAILNHDQHNINKLEIEKKSIEIDLMKQKQLNLEHMKEIEYQKSVSELKKINLEIKALEKKSAEYKKILLENGIEISVRHYSKNVTVPILPEMRQYNQ